MRHRMTIPLLIMGLASGVGALAAAGDERIVVPLSDPSRPVQLEVDLAGGGIEVTGYDGREVVVIPRNSTAQVERDGNERGMKRIPNTALGLSVTEQKNQVRVEGNWNNRSVDLLIQVPFRTSASIRTVQRGDIVVRGLQGELELENTNGGIEASKIKGSVVAHTTNGEVTVAFDEISPNKPMAFTTLNGNVDVSFPPSFRGDLHIEPGRGEILTDFDFEVVPTTPKVERGAGNEGYRVEVGQDVRAKVGGGGPVIHLKTFNGQIFIRKSR